MKQVINVFVLCFTMCYTQPFVRAQSAYTEKLLSEIQGKYTLNETGELVYTETVEADSVKKEDLFIRALAYFTKAYGSANAVIQVQDKEAGVIIGKGKYANVYTGHPAMMTITNDAWHILRVDVKDGKYRITLTLTTYDSITYDGNGRYSGTHEVQISSQYPINPSGKSKTVFGKTFYYLHERATSTMDAVKAGMMQNGVLTGW